MIDEMLAAIRATSDNMSNAIINSVEVDEGDRSVIVKLVTDKAYSQDDLRMAANVILKYVPEYFKTDVVISKLTPDAEIIKRRILEIIREHFTSLAATLSDEDVCVESAPGCFDYKISVMPFMPVMPDMCDFISARLECNFCGKFNGTIIASGKSAADLDIEEKQDEVEFEIPIRKFKIENFVPIESTKTQKNAVYIADLNFEGNEVVICGTVLDIKERTYKNRRNDEKILLSITLSDGTATTYLTYFVRQKSYDKIKNIKIGDSIVCTGTNELYKGCLRFTANYIDYGTPPKNFTPEKRESKPAPAYYHFVKPVPYIDMEQTDLFSVRIIPESLKGRSFVVFDLETTGLNSSPVSGNMDRIIEIGAYKIEDGKITECFSTFINPQRKLSEDIIRLTGITEGMVANAPTYEEVMPDFFKFCSGCILVGHNIAGFDFKFVDYYCARLGYILERKIIDTYPLSQELLFLGNYKLNTVAEYFKVRFNHHRATDDALATAKIFIELIKMKKSLPQYQ